MSWYRCHCAARSPFVGCLLDLQVRAGHRIDRELVGRDVALGLPSFVVRAETLT